MRKLLLASAVTIGALAMGVSAQAATEHYTAQLAGSSEVPATTSKGTGTADIMLDTKTRKMTYTIDYSGLSAPPAAAHFHGPAAVGSNAGVAVPISGDLTSPIKGTATLKPTQEKELRSGMMYVNIHTPKNKNGAIRGQVTKAE